jgi:hypothetical protein
MKNNKQRYEAPQAEIIEIESQGVLCMSGGPSTSTNATGNGGIQFGTSNGGW